MRRSGKFDNVVSRGNRRTSIKRPGALLCLAAAATLVLAGCSTNLGTSSQSAAKKAPAEPASISITPGQDSDAVSPSDPVTVAVKNGSLTKVTMRGSDGKLVTGAMTGKNTGWHSTEDLGYSKRYTVKATGKNAAGKQVTKKSKITTLTPDNMTMPSINRIGGYPLGNGETYGVAIVPVVHFDEPITDKAAALRTLQVETSPHVDGAWYFSDAQDVHFRPEHYWKPGTKVTVKVKDYGKDLGGGLYGQADKSASFTVGAKQLTKAYDNAPKVDKVKVYRDGKLLKTLNTSMGKHSGTYAAGRYIDFHTMQGTYTVMQKENPAMMSSASYGLPASAPGGYAPEPIYWSTKISTDGIFLHALPSTEYAQNNGEDVSHGCLNLSTADATWYFNHAHIGDPVEISGTGGPTIDIFQGGDWSVPWSKWKAGGLKN